MVVHLLQGMNPHEHFIIIQSPWFALQLILAAVHFMSVDKYIITCICHYHIIQSSFTLLKFLCAPLIDPSVSPSPDNHLSFYCLRSFANPRMLYS